MKLYRGKKMKTLRHGLVLILLALFMKAASAYAGTAPNILYIFTDDQSYRTVSCYPRSYEFANTPNIDKLAEQGIRFDWAYIGAKCAPSRATAQFGRLQFYVVADEALAKSKGRGRGPENRTWFETMRDAGYFTGMIGKWHWGDKREDTAWDWSLIWDRSIKGSGYYEGTQVKLNGGESFPLGGYSTDRYTDYAVEFIEKRAEDSDKPWLMWLCYGGVHGPYTPAQRHKGMLDDAPAPPVPVDIYGPRPGKPTHFYDKTKWRQPEPRDARWMDDEAKKWMGEKPDPEGQPLWHRKPLEFWVKQQVEAVAAIDEGVGRIVETLRATGQLDNTIIVFTADQGYVWGHHGLKGKIDHYDTAIRAPLIVSYPKRFPTAKVCRAPVNGADMVRSFLAWGNVKPDTVLTGRDMTPLVMQPELQGVCEEWNKIPTLMTYVRNRYDPWEMGRRLKEKEWGACLIGGGDGRKGPSGVPIDASPWYFMIHDGTYKYTRYANPDRIEELYDLNADPEELDNLAVKPAFNETLLEMREKCKQEIIRSGGAPFADYLPRPKMAY